ncbi:MAG: T9SS type A sorting domain-containing protein [Lewinellaceae bacterium]|nr:T9SS type A sorting domain-containing protein [Lewinellaceae bacterium]
MHLAVVPNPFRDEIRIDFETPHRQNIGIQLLDQSGKNVLKIPEQAYSAGKHQIQVSLKWFPKGTYTLLLLGQGKIITSIQTIKQ